MRGEESREAHGVEPICRALQFAPSIFYDRRAIARDPDRASARAKSDAAMSVKIDAAWDANRKLYGARKIWHVLRRQGEDAAPLSANACSRLPDSDRGSQYLSIKYTERLAEAEIDLSVGTVGDAYDRASGRHWFETTGEGPGGMRHRPLQNRGDQPDRPMEIAARGRMGNPEMA